MKASQLIQINTKTGYLILCVFLFSLSSCFTFKPVTLEKVEDVRIKNIGSKGVEAQIVAKINNPNSYSIKVISSDLFISLNNSEIGTAQLVKPVKIKAKSSLSYETDVYIKYKDLGTGILQTLPALLFKKSVQLHMKGNIKGKAGIISKKIFIDTKESVNLSK